MSITRRSFLECSSLAMLAAMSARTFAAGTGTGPLGKPIGLQLYTVREEANKDLLGTLKKLQAIGYREVETAGFYGKSGKEMIWPCFRSRRTNAVLHSLSESVYRRKLQSRATDVTTNHVFH